MTLPPTAVFYVVFDEAGAFVRSYARERPGTVAVTPGELARCTVGELLYIGGELTEAEAP